MRTEPADTNIALDRLPDASAEDDAAVFAREAAMLEEARAQARAGRVVDFDRVKAWIDSIGTDHELPVPYSDR
jgi:hypothetical protein